MAFSGAGAGRYNEDHEFHGVECLSILDSLVCVEQARAIHVADADDRRGSEADQRVGPPASRETETGGFTAAGRHDLQHFPCRR